MDAPVRVKHSSGRGKYYLTPLRRTIQISEPEVIGALLDFGAKLPEPQWVQVDLLCGKLVEWGSRPSL